MNAAKSQKNSIDKKRLIRVIPIRVEVVIILKN
jgi:hypothetical protein